MPGDQAFGAVLRLLREERRLTVAAAAARIGCDESLLRGVEHGRRRAQLWLLKALDELYDTGGMLVAAAPAPARRHHRANDHPAGGYSESGHTGPRDAQPHDDLLVLRLPEGVHGMPVSRRALLAGLSLGALGGVLAARLDQAVKHLVDASQGDPLAQLERSFTGLSAAARIAPPHQVIDQMIGHVALLHQLIPALSTAERTRSRVLLARHAESLSWLSEESGDATSGLYWLDRAASWASQAQWQAMTAFAFVRRSMLAVTFTDDGQRAVQAAAPALEMPGLSWVRGLAHRSQATGHALAGDAESCARALDAAMDLLAAPGRAGEELLGQRSVVGDDLYAVYQATCQIHLGRGEDTVTILEPRLDALTVSSLRTAAISRAKVARGYANAGDPSLACEHALIALEAANRVGSYSAIREIQRALPVLNRWRNRRGVSDAIDTITRMTEASAAPQRA